MAGKNIIICFDGTCNHPSDAKQEREWFGLGDIEDNGITNIMKLHALFGGTLDNKPHNSKQHSFYYSGVGTHGTKAQQIFNAAFAPKNLDVGRIIKTAGADLKKVFKPEDRVFLFGFSRGAALARRFAAVIDDYLPEGFDATTVVRFVGAFDTVASIGVPNLDDDDKPISDVRFLNCTLSSHVEEALHLVSLDDKRTAFMPTLMNKDERVTEIWFSGAHSDVGGGFWFDGLSDIALEFMVNALKDRELGLIILDPVKVKYNQLVAPKKEYRVDYDDVFIKPNYRGKIHSQDRWWPVALATLTVRDVRVIKNDKPAKEERPMIHHTVVKRIKDVVDYRPRALKGIPHDCLQENGALKMHTGIVDHIDIAV